MDEMGSNMEEGRDIIKNTLKGNSMTIVMYQV